MSVGNPQVSRVIIAVTLLAHPLAYLAAVGLHLGWVRSPESVWAEALFILFIAYICSAFLIWTLLAFLALGMIVWAVLNRTWVALIAAHLGCVGLIWLPATLLLTDQIQYCGP